LHFGHLIIPSSISFSSSFVTVSLRGWDLHTGHARMSINFIFMIWPTEDMLAP